MIYLGHDRWRATGFGEGGGDTEVVGVISPKTPVDFEVDEAAALPKSNTKIKKIISKFE